jgi:hypothetical protein
MNGARPVRRARPSLLLLHPSSFILGFSPMLLFPPVPYRKPRSRPRRRRRNAPAALVLVGAVYDANAPRVTLTFDRPIDISACDESAIGVDDGVQSGTQLQGQGGASLSGDRSVEIDLVVVGPWSGPDVRLDAGAATGIVAVDNGGTWPGVTDLLLPFP